MTLMYTPSLRRDPTEEEVRQLVKAVSTFPELAIKVSAVEAVSIEEFCRSRLSGRVVWDILSSVQMGRISRAAEIIGRAAARA